MHHLHDQPGIQKMLTEKGVQKDCSMRVQCMRGKVLTQDRKASDMKPHIAVSIWLLGNRCRAEKEGSRGFG